MIRHFKGLAARPKKKRKKAQQSFTVDSSNGLVVLEAGNRIKIPTLGTFKLKEKLPCRYVTQTFTISRIAARWFVSFKVNVDRVPPLFHEIVTPTGIELGVKTYATLSDGKEYHLPTSLKLAKTKLEKIQWRNRNKRLGNRKNKIVASNRAKIYYIKLANEHARLSNIRQDFLQKTTTEISRKYVNIAIEDLNVSGLIANHKLAEAISNGAFYEFRRQLEYKQQVYGTKLTIVERWFASSKTCSNCGSEKSDFQLKDRIYCCNTCSILIDRDLNAAINLSKQIPWVTGKFTDADKKEPTPLVEASSKIDLI